MRKFLRLRFIISALFIVSSIGAENKNELHQDKKEIKQDKREIRQTQHFLSKLSLTIDFWHDAYLKGDRKKINKYERNIITIIEEDIKSSYRQINRAKREVVHSKIEYVKDKKGNVAARDDRVDLFDDKKDLGKLGNMINTKKHLLRGIRKSNSFSYKYRLLGDYQELLRRELGTERLELAEDITEFIEDRRDNIKK